MGAHTEAHTATSRGFESSRGYWHGCQDYYDHTLLSKMRSGHVGALNVEDIFFGILFFAIWGRLLEKYL